MPRAALSGATHNGIYQTQKEVWFVSPVPGRQAEFLHQRDRPRMHQQTRQRLREARDGLAHGRPLTAAWLFSGSAIAAEVVAQGAFDFLILDTEHAPGTNDSLYHQLRATDAAGMPVVVRLPGMDAALAKQALDAGAAGLAVPDLRSAPEAQALVHASRYAPGGGRGTHRLARAARYGFGWQDYVDTIAPELLMLALIESGEGVAAMPQICAVDGLDAVFIGAVDLAASLGHLGEPAHPRVQRAIADIRSAASDAGMPLGGLAGDAAAARRLFEDGYAIASVGSDLAWLRDAVMRVGPQEQAR